MSPADLAADTRVTRHRAAPGWFTADLPNHWDYLSPSGGVLMTVALRAMAEELGDPSLKLVSATTLFCSPVPSGPLAIRVEILRHGAVAAQIRAALSSTALPGPGLEVSATFAREREGFVFADAAPQVTPPGESPPSRFLHSFRIFENIESRSARALESEPPIGDERTAQWFRYGVPQRGKDGFFDPLAIPPIADTMPPALMGKVGPGASGFQAPSLDLTVHFLEPTTSDWLFASARARCARAGYAAADIEIFGEDGRLTAFATQTMIIRRIPPGALT